jgi:succinate dehydrogenase subunit D
MSGPRISHAANWRTALWLAALVHRLSGIGLACFLPLHFFVLGTAIEGTTPIDSLLRWTDAPAVKFAEAGLMFLLFVHMLGGLRLLAIENLPWVNWQKQLATAAVTASMILAFVFLVRVL